MMQEREPEEDCGLTPSARLRRICSATDDDEPEELVLELLNNRNYSHKEANSNLRPLEHHEDREETQSARLSRLCSATDDDEPEALVIQLLNVKSNSIKESKKDLSVTEKDDAGSSSYLEVDEDWNDDCSEAAPKKNGKDMQLILIGRSGFLYGTPGVSKSMKSMPVRDGSPIQRDLLKTRSARVMQTPERHVTWGTNIEEPCSPGLLPSALKKQQQEEMEGEIDTEDRYAEEEKMDKELSYVDVLFSKIRHNRVGYVSSELEKGCNPAIKVTI